MIIYGWRSAHLKSAQSKTANCPGCGTNGSMVFSVFSRHAHVFWIPLFPFGKTGGAQCQHCDHTLKIKEFPEDLRRDYDQLKSETRVPLWQFSGLAVIALIVAFVTYAGQKDEEETLANLADPLAGDIYEFETESRNYSTFKLVKVTVDSVFVSFNDYETNKMTGIDDIDLAENYSDAIYGLSKLEVKEMYDEGTIYDINRD